MSDDWKSKVRYFSSKDANDPEKVRAYKEYMYEQNKIGEMSLDQLIKLHNAREMQREHLRNWMAQK